MYIQVYNTRIKCVLKAQMNNSKTIKSTIQRRVGRPRAEHAAHFQLQNKY